MVNIRILLAFLCSLCHFSYFAYGAAYVSAVSDCGQEYQPMEMNENDSSGLFYGYSRQDNLDVLSAVIEAYKEHFESQPTAADNTLANAYRRLHESTDIQSQSLSQEERMLLSLLKMCLMSEFEEGSHPLDPRGARILLADDPNWFLPSYLGETIRDYYEQLATLAGCCTLCCSAASILEFSTAVTGWIVFNAKIHGPVASAGIGMTLGGFSAVFVSAPLTALFYQMYSQARGGFVCDENSCLPRRAGQTGLQIREAEEASNFQNFFKGFYSHMIKNHLDASDPSGGVEIVRKGKLDQLLKSFDHQLDLSESPKSKHVVDAMKKTLPKLQPEKNCLGVSFRTFMKIFKEELALLQSSE